jgi:hypothetical protein
MLQLIILIYKKTSFTLVLVKKNCNFKQIVSRDSDVLSLDMKFVGPDQVFSFNDVFIVKNICVNVYSQHSSRNCNDWEIFCCPTYYCSLEYEIKYWNPAHYCKLA